jgi:hypothetical protein
MFNSLHKLHSTGKMMEKSNQENIHKAVLRRIETLEITILNLTKSPDEIKRFFSETKEDISKVLGVRIKAESEKRVIEILNEAYPEIEYLYAAIKKGVNFSDFENTAEKGLPLAIAAYEKKGDFRLVEKWHLEKVDYAFGERQSRRYFIKPIITEIIKARITGIKITSTRMYEIYVRMNKASTRRKKIALSDKKLIVVANNNDNETIIIVYRRSNTIVDY